MTQGGYGESMAPAVCLLFDAAGEQTIQRLWSRLEDEGVSTLLSHAHGLHVPHLSYESASPRPRRVPGRCCIGTTGGVRGFRTAPSPLGSA